MAQVCQGCGTRQADWDIDKNAYIGDLYRCEGCSRRADEEDNIPKDPDGKPQSGWIVRLVRKDIAKARAALIAQRDRLA